MNELHLFAGAGGGILGGMLLGHTCVCAVEIEPYAREVLLQRQRDGILPRFPIWDDVRTFDGRQWNGIADIVCGGFPCQDISSVGTRAGLEGAKSGLWAEMRRVISEVRPRHVLVENSPMLTVRGLDRVLGDLAELGHDARWGVLGARHTGKHHHRERIWILSTDADVKRGGSTTTESHSQDSPNMGDNNEAINSFDRLLARFERETEARKGEGGLPSYLCRVDDGVGQPVDRLAAIGNGQVPAVVRLAWETLIMESI